MSKGIQNSPQTLICFRAQHFEAGRIKERGYSKA